MSIQTMDGVTFDTVVQTEKDSLDGRLLTSFQRMSVEDAGFGLELRAADDGPAVAWADATSEWFFDTPDGVDELAEFMRTTMAESLAAFAALWRQRIADGTIPAPEA